MAVANILATCVTLDAVETSRGHVQSIVGEKSLSHFKVFCGVTLSLQVIDGACWISNIRTCEAILVQTCTEVNGFKLCNELIVDFLCRLSFNFEQNISDATTMFVHRRNVATRIGVVPFNLKTCAIYAWCICQCERWYGFIRSTSRCPNIPSQL